MWFTKSQWPLATKSESVHPWVKVDVYSQFEESPLQPFQRYRVHENGQPENTLPPAGEEVQKMTGLENSLCGGQGANNQSGESGPLSCKAERVPRENGELDSLCTQRMKRITFSREKTQCTWLTVHGEFLRGGGKRGLLSTAEPRWPLDWPPSTLNVAPSTHKH